MDLSIAIYHFIYNTQFLELFLCISYNQARIKCITITNTFKYIYPLAICLPPFFRVLHHQALILCALNTMQAPFSWHLPDS